MKVMICEGIITKTLETTCDFYQGDWCGFIEVDMDLDLWTLTAWYKKTRRASEYRSELV